MNQLNSPARIDEAMDNINGLLQVFLWRKVTPYAVVHGNVTFRAKLLELRNAIDKYLAGGG